jgi:hypothetical protein
MIKLIDLLKEDNPFVLRGSKEERKKDYKRVIQTQIQQYVKDGMKGDLDLFDTPITSLPDNLTVGGDLNLEYTDIDKLPSNLTVKGNLHLYSTLLTSLPSDLKLGGSLNLRKTPLSKKYSEDEIRAMVPNVKGKIYI